MGSRGYREPHSPLLTAAPPGHTKTGMDAKTAAVDRAQCTARMLGMPPSGCLADGAMHLASAFDSPGDVGVWQRRYCPASRFGHSGHPSPRAWVVGQPPTDRHRSSGHSRPEMLLTSPLLYPSILWGIDQCASTTCHSCILHRRAYWSWPIRPRPEEEP